LRLVEDATGSRTLTMPASVHWFGAALTQLSPANAVDLIVLYFDGSKYWVTYALNGT
jgi:hypothetical protein